MKRADALLKLSREHHTALSIAQRARRALAEGVAGEIESVAAAAARRFAAELEPHFLDEERWLLPALAGAGEDRLVDRTLDEHHRLRVLAAALPDGGADALAAFAQLLSDHVRFEERELFECAQARIPADELARLSARDC
ncbi:hemerythrin domain-containing protein [Cognatazoarcus halotolerans]|uniref:hemerythrin domain-containing protein n=1 Tax=Cognatazoarcus halotolerans TaxID=2686016 RepID=UPI0013595E3B|nr:hemerythrin domain-containing protein [Cognatazoarcus halotolerans]MBX3679180.1 hemerythrin domain-containing protein [Rhodocyclaceae bacterium]MCB1899075.1 hemerythrin domain-containing protein [Rhodocyclaceae bacterium]MCP5311012.1 hemerythrin domain-containing protein [Zoogloeaceae bacterium]